MVRARYVGTRKIAAWLGAFLLLLISGIVLHNKTRPRKPPNVILISIDTLRADHLGCYGYARSTTPNIDKFSKNSVLFKNCIAQAPSTTASHASMFTSLIRSHHGASHAAKTAIPERIITMAEFLRNDDYATASYNEGGQVSASYGFAQGFDLYESCVISPPGQFGRIVEKAIAWLETHRGDTSFLFLHTYESHHPYTPSDEHLSLFEDHYTGSLPRHIPGEMLKKMNHGKIEISSEDLEHIVNCYDAEIRSVDESFLLLEEYLRKKNTYDDTMIIVTSDHGEEFDEHGWVGWHSHTLYDELIKVPLIIKFPYSDYGGTIVDKQVRSIDILPTLLDVLGTGKSDLALLEGTSLMPVIKGTEMDQRYAVSEFDNARRHPSSAIRTEGWKLYGSKLFDLDKDPLEQEDAAEGNEAIRSDLQDRLTSILEQSPYDVESEEADLDQETLDRLKSLGYVNSSFPSCFKLYYLVCSRSGPCFLGIDWFMQQGAYSISLPLTKQTFASAQRA